jgi:hypothetical protein
VLAVLLLPQAIAAQEAPPSPAGVEASAMVDLGAGSYRVVTVLVDTSVADPQAVLEELLPAGKEEGEPRAEAAFTKWITWDVAEMPLVLTYDASEAREGIDGEAALIAMMGQWNTVSGTTFEFRFGGPGPQSASVCDEPGGPDGHNTVGWRRDLPKGTLAQTCLEVRSGISGMQAVEMDVVFATSIKWSTEDETPKDHFDFQSTMVHELGHVIGLAHSSAAGSVMRESIGAGMQRRTLGQDDVTGVQSLYPGESDAAADPPPTSPALKRAVVLVGLGRD